MQIVDEMAFYVAKKVVESNFPEYKETGSKKLARDLCEAFISAKKEIIERLNEEQVTVR